MLSRMFDTAAELLRRTQLLKIFHDSLNQTKVFYNNEKQQFRTVLTDKYGLANINSNGRHFKPQLLSFQTKFNTCAAIEWRCTPVVPLCVVVASSCLLLSLVVGLVVFAAFTRTSD